ncbi:MAG: peroxiredoxin [Bacteroidota bacterium]
MALQKNTTAPDFTLPSTSGEDFILSEHKGKPLVLFFYPKDFSPVCTKEACTFRDQFEAFRDLEVTVLGISRDDLETHHRFRDKHNLPFHLLADKSGKVSRLYKAQLPIVGMSSRVTYVLDGDHTIRLVIDGMAALVDAEPHIKKSLEELRAVKK